MSETQQALRTDALEGVLSLTARGFMPSPDTVAAAARELDGLLALLREGHRHD